MLDRKIGLAVPDPEKAADRPAAGVARVERQRTIDEPDHRTHVLAAPREHLGGIGEDARVVLRHLERLPREVGGLAASYLRFFGPAFSEEPQVAVRRPGERCPITRIDRDRLLEQPQSLDDSLFRYWKECCKRAQ